MADGSEKISLPPKPHKQVIDTLTEPVKYECVDYGLKTNQLSGKGVSIAILDSGCPQHSDITNIVDSVSLVNGNDKNSVDVFGHATMVAGVMAANNMKRLKGIAPGSKLYFAKVTNDEGEADFNALVAGVLWAAVKRVDIIVMALGSIVDYTMLHDAIEKAFKENICVVSAWPNGKNVDFYPALYPEVLSFVARPKNRKLNNSGKKNIVPIQIPSSGITTTYGANQYMKVYGSSFAAGIGTGLLSLIIERDKGKAANPSQLYKDIYNLF